MELKYDFEPKPTAFPDVPSLTTLSLRGCCEWVTDDVLESLSSGGMIETALLFRCWRVTDRGIIRFVRKNGASLRQLELSGCTHLTDSSLAAIGRYCPRLEQLDLTRCLGVSDIGINHIVIPSLHSLLLFADSQLRSSSYEAIASNPSWRSLDFCGHSNLSSRDIISIVDACGHNLEYLNLTWCVELTNEVITHILESKTLGKIKYLSLFGLKNLTDMRILVQYLAGIPSLTHLDVRGVPSISDLTSEDCKQLRQLLPRLVEWKLHH